MIGWVIETLVATTLLLVAVLLVRGPVRQAFGSGVTYALWLLPAVRLALPPLPGDWRLSRLLAPLATAATHAPGIVVGVLNPVSLQPDVMRHATVASAAIGPSHAVVALVPPVHAAGGPNVTTLIMIFWIAGAALFLGYHIAAHLLFCRRLVRRATGRRETAIGRVRVIESFAATSPLAFGILRPCIAFPHDFAARYDADERALALLHELSHHQRGDLIVNWAALVMLALHWFDPVAWRAFRAFRADQEMATDARVLAGRSAIDRHAYACAIVKAAHAGFGTVAATCQLNTVEDLKGRLKMLTTGRCSRVRLACGIAAVVGMTVAGLALTASGQAAAAITAPFGEPAAQTTAAPAPSAAPVVDETPPPSVTPPPVEAPARSGLSVTTTVGRDHVKHVVVVKDGKSSTYDGTDADAYLAANPTPSVPDALHRSRMVYTLPDADMRIEVQDVPAVSSAKCGVDTASKASMVVDTGKGGKRMIVVCTDRIERVVADAAASVGKTKDVERTAYAKALSGLLDARTSVVADGSMSAADRTRALAAIDQSIAEMRNQLARMN